MESALEYSKIMNAGKVDDVEQFLTLKPNFTFKPTWNWEMEVK